jgi:hypothetical protein
MALNDATLFGRQLSLSGSTGHTPLKHAGRIRREMSSRPEEFHLWALPEPCMTLSSHTAPDVRPLP